jgi:hypothetical protein
MANTAVFGIFPTTEGIESAVSSLALSFGSTHIPCQPQESRSKISRHEREQAPEARDRAGPAP